MIVVGLLHHEVLAELTLNASNVTIGEDGPDGVAPGDYVAVTIHGPGAWERDMTWTPASAEPLWSADLDVAVRPRPSPSPTCGGPARSRDPSVCSSLDRSRRKGLRTLPDELLEHSDVHIDELLEPDAAPSGLATQGSWYRPRSRHGC